MGLNCSLDQNDGQWLDESNKERAAQEHNRLRTQVRAANALTSSLRTALRRFRGKKLTEAIEAALQRYQFAISLRKTNADTDAQLVKALEAIRDKNPDDSDVESWKWLARWMKQVATDALSGVTLHAAVCAQNDENVSQMLQFGGRALNYRIQAANAEEARRVAIFANARRIGKTRLTQAIFDDLVDEEVSMLLTLGSMQRKCLQGPIKKQAQVEDVCACCCDVCEIGEHCYTKNVCFNAPIYETEEAAELDVLTASGFVEESSLLFTTGKNAGMKLHIAPWDRREAI